MMMLDAYESSMVKQRQQVRGGSKETKKDAERQALAYCTIRTSKRRYPSAVIMGAGLSYTERKRSGDCTYVHVWLDVHLLSNQTAYIFFHKEPLTALTRVIRICFLDRAVLFTYARDRCR